MKINHYSESWDGPSEEMQREIDARRLANDPDLEAAIISWQMMQERKRIRGFANRKPSGNTCMKGGR